MGTDLFRSRGTKHDGVFGANEYFVLDAHAKAMKVFRELRIGRDVHAYRTSERWLREALMNMAQVPGSIVMTIPSFSLFLIIIKKVQFSDRHIYKNIYTLTAHVSPQSPTRASLKKSPQTSQ